MDDFATADDLATLLKRTLSGAEIAAAELILAGASAAIRSFTRQTLSLVPDDELVVDRRRNLQTVWLPERPVVAVASITIDGELVPPTSYRVDNETGEVTFDSIVGRWGTSTAFDPRIVIVYSHGLDPVADDVRDACLAITKGVFDAPENDATSKEQIGNYAIEYLPDVALKVLADNRGRLAHYRAPALA